MPKNSLSTKEIYDLVMETRKELGDKIDSLAKIFHDFEEGRLTRVELKVVSHATMIKVWGTVITVGLTILMFALNYYKP